MSRTPMKLILTQEVTGLGTPGDIVEVAGGYGRNYLIPRGLAMRWTRGAEKQIDLIKRARSAREIRGLDDAKQVAAQLAAADGAPGDQGRGDRAAFRLRLGGRHRCGRASRRWSGAGPAPHRSAQPDQDRGRAPGCGAAAPRGQRDAGHRDRRGLTPGTWHRAADTGGCGTATLARRRACTASGERRDWLPVASKFNAAIGCPRWEGAQIRDSRSWRRAERAPGPGH